MDKGKVISAYRRGFITLQECAQILGIDSTHILGMLSEQIADKPTVFRKKPVNG